MDRSPKRFFRSENGTVSVMVALLLPALLAFVALVAEFGHGLVVKAENQRIADLAAFAGATAYTASNSTSDMNAAVARVASLNGIASADATASLVASPRGNGSQAVSVVVSTGKTLVLAPALGAQTGLTIAANAAAEVAAVATPGCIIALDAAQTGVTLSGGTAISAPACAVSSNNTVTVPCGTSITTKSVNYNSVSVPSQPCNGIQPPAGQTLTLTKTATADPLSADSSVSAATTRLTTVAAMSAPAAPTVPSSTNDINFAWDFNTNSLTKLAAQAAGCTADGSGGVWTLTCSSAGPHNFRNLTTGGGITVNFNTAGAASKTYNFSGRINFTGTSISFGPGTYNIAQGITTGGGTTTTFAAGTYNIGASTVSCSGATYSICHTGTTLTFGGPSTFVLRAGIYNDGGATLNIGSGTTNTYEIGASSAGHALNVGGGSKTTFADAVGSTVKFVGNLNMASGGGSCLVLPAATNHDIKGYFASAGGNILGAGVYTITGYLALGASGGGNVTCTNASGVSASVGVSATDVSIVLGGSTLPSSGTCSGQAFCVGAGYSSVSIVAPTSSKLAVIGPTSAGTAGATFTSGATNTSVSGVLYFPRGPILMSGGANLGNGPGQCLQIIGSRITLTGGTAAASACITSGAGGSGSVMLVQ